MIGCLIVGGVQVAFKDISGRLLTGISKWAESLGGEYNNPAKFFNKDAKFFTAIDGYYRSSFLSSPSPSAFLNIDGYTILNARISYKATRGYSAFVWRFT